MAILLKIATFFRRRCRDLSILSIGGLATSSIGHGKSAITNGEEVGEKVGMDDA
jgi:hypothetical protein